MTREDVLRIEVVVAGKDPLSGTVRGPKDGRPENFAGWLELLACLEDRIGNPADLPAASAALSQVGQTKSQ